MKVQQFFKRWFRFLFIIILLIIKYLFNKKHIVLIKTLTIRICKMQSFLKRFNYAYGLQIYCIYSYICISYYNANTVLECLHEVNYVIELRQNFHINHFTFCCCLTYRITCECMLRIHYQIICQQHLPQKPPYI